MGGFGSGKSYVKRRKRRGLKLFTSDLPRIDIPKMMKDVKETPSCYFVLKNIKLKIVEDVIHLEDLNKDQRTFSILRIASIPCNYGGFRYFGLCPICQKKVTKLYLFKTMFACRHCLKLAYPSQNETLHLRLLTKKYKAKEKLNKDEWTKPKWMRQKTFDRLRKEFFSLSEMSDFADMFSLRTNRQAKALSKKYVSVECVPVEVVMTSYGKYCNNAL
jgi:hypothetical protein